MYSPKHHPSKPSQETKATIDMIKSDLDSGIKGEQTAIKYYENMVAVYGDYGCWRGIFTEILNDEREHLAKLLEAKRAVEEKEGTHVHEWKPIVKDGYKGIKCKICAEEQMTSELA